tara:strand:- start:212 stop:769 length:558 start_codon:yes stop_codon:yes gene_type:complete
MNIQDNCADIPEKPTENNFGLLLSKKYRAKIAERYSNFFYKKFFKRIPNKYVLKFDAYSDLEIIQYALNRLESGEIKSRSDLPIENIEKLNENIDSQLSEYRKLTLNSWVSTADMAECLGVTEKQLLEWRKQGYRPLDNKKNKKLALREGMTWRLKRGHTRTYEWNFTHTAYCDDVFWSDKAYFD